MKRKIRWLRDVKHSLFPTQEWASIGTLPPAPKPRAPKVFKQGAEQVVHIRGSKKIVSITGIGDLPDLREGIDFECVSADACLDEGAAPDRGTAGRQPENRLLLQGFDRVPVMDVVLEQVEIFLSSDAIERRTLTSLGRWLDWVCEGLRGTTPRAGAAEAAFLKFLEAGNTSADMLSRLLQDAAGFSDYEASSGALSLEERLRAHREG